MSEELNEVLREFIEEFDCTSGTLHRAAEGRLHLVAHEGMPESVVERIETIPIGKGMAGTAAERREPVQLSNLQTDDSDVVESGARDTGMEGSITAPIIGPEGTLAGTLGIAKPEPYEFTPDERDRLMSASERLADRLR